MSTLHDMGEQVRNVIFKKFRRLIWYFQDIVSITKCSRNLILFWSAVPGSVEARIKYRESCWS